MKTLFIHRSVGNNLIQDGNLYHLLADSVFNTNFADYNNNDGFLRDTYSKKKLGLKFPNDNTKPSDYAELFSEEGLKVYSNLYDFIMEYDRIIIKSCYPNSNIKSDEELEQTINNYSQIVSHFNSRNKQLVIMTSPPLRPSSTNSENASRAKRLAIWLTTQDFGKNVTVFDLFSLLASDTHVLKKKYRRLIWLDNHPNVKASKDIAPKIVAKLTET